MGFWEFLGDVAEGALEYQSIVANENAEYVDKGIRCYKNGNYNEAFRYFKMAAERNNSNAMYNLALCYRYGEGTDMDYEEAVYWYRKAAEKGVSGAKEAIDEIGSDTGCLIQKDDLFAIRKGYITKFSLSNVSYSWNGNNYTDRKVTIKIGRLQNESAHHSGSVKLKFWYCKTAYNGDHLDGTLMAEDVYSSSGSRGNCYGWSDIEFVMDMDGNPPTGDYFPVLTINELDEDGKWYIVGYCNFDNKKHWNHEEPGKSTDCLIKKDDLYAIRKGFITDFSLSDVSCDWDGDNYTNRKVTIKIGRLQNEAVHHSGSIKLCFRFCNTKYSGGTIDGYLMASDIYSKEGCRGEQYGWNDVEFTMDMDGNPPTGDYFPILTVNELDEDGSWYIVGYCNFDKKQHWNHEEDALGVDDMISLADEHWNNEEYEEAAELFLEAAEQGNAYAQYSIGYCYEKGVGTNQAYRMAVEWYKKAAEQGYADAQVNLGLCYENGNGIPQNYAKAVEWYAKAAEQAHAVAQYNLGLCYFNGNGVLQNYAKAVEWFQKAAEQGYAGAQDFLGDCYTNGNGVVQNYSKAVEWYQKAAEQGNRFSQFSLACCYANGNGVVQNYNKAAEWYQEAAEQGHAGAQIMLGLSYENGEGVEQNYQKAVEWYQKAAEQGDADAQFRLGLCYELGNGIPQNYNKAVEWYQKAAEQDNADAQNNLGFCYVNGNGVQQNYVKAVEWYQKAVEQGNVAAQDNLGDCYANGNGVPQNYSKAVEWYQKAAEQGNMFSQFSLGLCYANGNGVSQNYAKAVEWYQKAAEQGNASAQNNLGLCYENGNGVPQNYAKAVECYEKAIEMGNIIAQCNLADCYEKGNGVTKDYNKALELYNLAFENGFEDAKEGIDRVTAILNGGNVESTATHSDNEQEYIETLKEIIADDGEITDRERRLLEKLRTKLGISESRAKELEDTLANPSLTAEEQEYLDEYKSIVADGEITDKERKLLDKIRKMSGISEERAREIEKMA